MQKDTINNDEQVHVGYVILFGKEGEMSWYPLIVNKMSNQLDEKPIKKAFKKIKQFMRYERRTNEHKNAAEQNN